MTVLVAVFVASIYQVGLLVESLGAGGFEQRYEARR